MLKCSINDVPATRGLKRKRLKAVFDLPSGQLFALPGFKSLTSKGAGNAETAAVKGLMLYGRLLS